MSEFKRQEIRFIAQDLTGLSSFTKLLSLPFTPAKMRVKNIQYRYLMTDAGIENELLLIRMKSLNRIIGSFGDGQMIHPELQFDVSGSNVIGSQEFEILSSDGDVDANNDGVLIIVLEFLA